MVCLQSEISRLLRSTKLMTNGEGAGPLQNHPLHSQWAYQPPFASKDTSTRSTQRDSGSKLDVGRISRVVGLKDNENHRPFPLSVAIFHAKIINRNNPAWIDPSQPFPSISNSRRLSRDEDNNMIWMLEIIS